MEDMKEFIIGHEIEVFWALIFAFFFALLMEIIFKPFRKWREQIKNTHATNISVLMLLSLAASEDRISLANSIFG